MNKKMRLVRNMINNSHFNI